MRLRNIKGERKLNCSKCANPVESSRNGQRYCKSCHAANMRAIRPKHKDLPELSRKKANCRAYTKEYVKRGYILRMPCWICNEKAEAHHEDYSKPKDVIWLCRAHHLELHKITGYLK